MDFFHLINNTPEHHFQIEIMIASSIFLSSKVFESERKIRDILNMVFAVTALHRIVHHEQEDNQKISLKTR